MSDRWNVYFTAVVAAHWSFPGPHGPLMQALVDMLKTTVESRGNIITTLLAKKRV